MSELFFRGSLMVVTAILSLLPTLALAEENPRETPLVRAVRESRKSVVNIHTEKSTSEDKDARFFTARPRKVTGMGTGIVVDERGYIVTNYHVIQDVDLINVTIHGGSTYEGRPVSYDRKHDLAIIRITSPEPLTVMPMGTSSDLMLAESVYAVGNAFGYEDTITEGIISALHRDVEVDETQAYENLIQTSASINPGNSGGPLLNLNGEVIGINVAIRSGAQRIGFAIPIDDARRTIARLMSVEKLNGLPHGLSTEDVKSSEERKLVVQEVHTGSAADLCGIRAGDVIRSVRGLRIHDGTDFERALLDQPQGRVVDVILVRDGREQTMQFTIGVGRKLADVAWGSQDIVIPGKDQTVSLAPPSSPPASSSGTTDSVKTPQIAARPATQSGVAASQPRKTADNAAVPTIPASSGTTPPPTTKEDPGTTRAWEVLGLKLEVLSDADRKEITSRVFTSPRGPVRYNGGLKVTQVGPNSPASRFFQAGDVLLGLNGFETLTSANLQYLLDPTRISNAPTMKCQIYRRGSSPMEATLTLSSR
ncbi:MAG: trypsin-like peptidase domain-containing protein [Planctomycetota bacterium]